MVKYHLYQGRPCGSSARGGARWLRSALEQEALRRGISGIGTLDEICARLIAYDSSIPKKQEIQRREKQEVQRREKQEVQRREKQEVQRREKQEVQRREKQEVQRPEIPKNSLDQSIAWLTSYVGIYNTIYWSSVIRTESMKYEYLYRCNAKCPVPKDYKIINQVFDEYNRSKIDYIREQTGLNKLKEDPSLKPEDCRVTHSSEFLPKKCIRNLEKDAIFENRLDHRDYQRVDDIRCPSDCEAGYSHIYHKLQTNEYFILFQSGNYMKERESAKLFGGMIFVNKVLLKYLGKGYRVVIGGHSS